ncbi:rod shape-determining protein [Acidithrix ferrooxidans]|uniref:Rod shape-determining protein MreB n=1 Tax=Acidithrix ferrooxidans TaxID=1280514 RepID=A0A0D8HDZ3_9ACTN|nr:rod shape-determining protein [Acidithrix ferrooxidans]KJF16002.1 Rod shape-determining protein MreB [Acidithrix ferrooxidans]
MRGSRLSRAVALDLGSSTISWCDTSTDEVVSEPNLIIFDQKKGKIVEIGEAAASMQGRVEGNLRVSRPVRNGRIEDVSLAEQYFKAILRRVGQRHFSKPTIGLCAPIFMTGAEKRVIAAAMSKAGASNVIFIDSLVSAGVGANLEMQGPVGTMVASVGAQTTFAGILSLGDVVESRSELVGGDSISEDIAQFLRNRYNVTMLSTDIEELKVSLLDVAANGSALIAKIIGRDVDSGEEITVQMGGEELVDAVDSTISAICDVVLATLKEAPAEIAKDLALTGIALVGGSSQIKGLESRLEALAGVPVRHASVVERAVVVGAARILGQVPSK